MDTALPSERSRAALRSRVTAAVATLLIVACGPSVTTTSQGATSGASGDGGSSTSSGAEPGGSAATSSATGTGTSAAQTDGGTGTTTSTTGGSSSSGSTTEDPGLESSAFIPIPDGGYGSLECDQWVQDCPPGQKCTAAEDDNGNLWNTTRCVAVAEDPDGVGEACTVEGSVASGIDSCDFGQICWVTNWKTLVGVCREYCSGTPHSPVCAPSHYCQLTADGVLTICLPECDPFAQDCGPAEGCYGGSEWFGCAPDSSGDEGNFGDPCEFVNACSIGLSCQSGSELADCETGACCTSFCDISEAAPCPEGYTCNAFHEPGNAPPNQENYGYCISA